MLIVVGIWLGLSAFSFLLVISSCSAAGRADEIYQRKAVPPQHAPADPEPRRLQLRHRYQAAPAPVKLSYRRPQRRILPG
jgi:hypothetical protein